MPRGRQTPVEIRREVHRLVREEGVTNAAEIYRYLERKFTGTGVPVPSERSIRNLVRELVPPDPSGPWAPGPDNDPREDALILTTLAERPRRWPDRWAGKDWLAITNEHARWLVWLRTGWPDIDPLVALALAAEYRARREAGRETADLDAYLAFAPWRSRDAYQQWDAAIKAGLVQEPPNFYGSWAAFTVMAKEVREEGKGDVKQAPEGSR